jgi:hypothetical protein
MVVRTRSSQAVRQLMDLQPDTARLGRSRTDDLGDVVGEEVVRGDEDGHREEVTGTAERPVLYIPARSARSLCGRSLDWVEAIVDS